ncbi:hypothetical protein ACFQL5_17500 [Aquipuribacter hungaricus]|uniref:hypothetical protein n=1 Tax=Aquipuribacter hungaricus TaxID=545624 RepID=UPI00361EA37A
MSAVTLVATALGATVLGCAAAGALGQVAAARAGTDGAADLAALAAAGRVVRGEPHATACGVGATVAAGPSTVLTGCTVAGEVVTVTVMRDLTLFGATVAVRAVARAGPVDDP